MYRTIELLIEENTRKEIFVEATGTVARKFHADDGERNVLSHLFLPVEIVSHSPLTAEFFREIMIALPISSYHPFGTLLKFEFQARRTILCPLGLRA